MFWWQYLLPQEEVRGLAEKIGEKASPQDVDLSLMVLASKLVHMVDLSPFM